jgi:serine/threonine protein kinase
VTDLIDGRYALRDEIGRGATAAVHRARDVQGGEVAIKLLTANRGSRQAVGRFIREAHLASQLQHPNNTRILDFGAADQGMYLVMELLTGETLESRIFREGPLPPRAAAGVAICVASALGEAHGLGIIHRDLKPANIFLHRDGRGTTVKLMDFGVAKLASTESRKAGGLYATTLVGTDKLPPIGTVQYMAPEQVKGKQELSPASDLYSLGCLLYKMLTGDPPFSGENQFAVMRCQVQDPPPRLSFLTPTELADVVYKLLEKEPEMRPGSAAEVVSALRGWLLS